MELSTQTIKDCAFHGCTALTKVWLRDTVETLVTTDNKKDDVITDHYGLFHMCSSSLVIYCEADEKPDGWSEYWNVYEGTDKYLTVVLGQKTRPW